MSKVLLVSDSPYATTGLGRMSRYFIRMFPEHEWFVWGAHHNHFEVQKGKWITRFDQSDFEADFQVFSPFTLGTNDHFAYQYLGKFIEQVKPDVLLTSADFDRILPAMQDIKNLQFAMDFKWINYFPADREDIKEGEADAFRFPDENVCITKFGLEKHAHIAEKIGMKQIYHPIDIEDFPELDKLEAREKAFPSLSNIEIMFGAVGRSFSRKDSARLTVAASRHLAKYNGDFFHIHGSHTMSDTRVDLRQIAKFNGCPPNTISFLPEQVSEVDAISQEAMNRVYASFDVYVSASLGEGFGYPTVEAMMHELPMILPNNTSFPELAGKFAYLIDPSGDSFAVPGNSSYWPHMSTEDMVEKFGWVRNNLDKAQEKARGARQWVINNLSLDVIKEQWRPILEK